MNIIKSLFAFLVMLVATLFTASHAQAFALGNHAGGFFLGTLDCTEENNSSTHNLCRENGWLNYDTLSGCSVATNKIPTGLETRGVKIPGGRKINDTIPGSTKVTNSQGEIFKRVDNPPSKPHGGMESHTHPNFRNVSPDGTVRSGVSKEGIPQTPRDIIDAARDGAQRTGGL